VQKGRDAQIVASSVPLIAAAENQLNLTISFGIHLALKTVSQHFVGEGVRDECAMNASLARWSN
jgi:hypothetical protein